MIEAWLLSSSFLSLIVKVKGFCSLLVGILDRGNRQLAKKEGEIYNS